MRPRRRITMKGDLGAAHSRLQFPRDAFVRAVCAVYAVAFVSVGEQIRGLYGEDGLEPVDVFLTRLIERNEALRDRSPIARMVAYPTMVWLHEVLHWSPSFTMQVLALLGATVSLLAIVTARWRTTLPLAIVWYSYLSIVQCGQTFMQFQWDSFLLEVGFLAIWTAPWWPSRAFEPPAAVVWTLRFLFFKFMLMSGAVKIQSRCRTWLGLSALEFHFATQPLPLPLSWYAHQLPPIFLRLGVAATLLFEGPWTFFIMTPFQALRQFSAVMQVLLQVMIMLTGNYNFFNILTITMACALLDKRVTVSRAASSDRSAPTNLVMRLDGIWQSIQRNEMLTAASLLLAVCFCIYSIQDIFGFQVSTVAGDSWEDIMMSISITFKPSVEEAQAWLGRILPVSLICSALLVAGSALWQLLVVLADATRRRHRMLTSVYLLVATSVSAWTFCSSALTLSILDRPFQHSLPSTFYHVYETSSPLRITSAYGLFRTMTGVGTYNIDGAQYTVVARPEIIIEGTDDDGATWKSYHFLYKPGDVDVAPRVNVPFQPRLDWQMWFAALGDYQDAPWIVHLVDKLLKGSPDVKALLDGSRNPFPGSPPTAIRAQLFYYDYTRLNTTWNCAIPTAVIVNRSSGTWWSRTLVEEYMPALEQGNPSVAAFVRHHFGRRDDASASDLSSCDASSSWVCRWLVRLVSRPRVAPVLIVSSIALSSLVTSVAMSALTTQSPKQKIE